MERKVIDLEIVDELEDSGVNAIALVDTPAIEKNFMYFRQEKFVEPKSGESESDYMGRCVPVLIGEGKEQDQAVAICISTYENMSIDTSALPPYVDETGKKKQKFAAQGIILPRGEKVVLQAEDQNYDRGLVVELKDDGGYDVQYWYDTPDNIEPVEVKIDGETITKSGNLVYLGYHPELEEFASVDELSVGDEVSWKTADQNPRGKITEIVIGSKKVPGADFEIQGTEEDPGYLIEIYEEVEGKWEPTGKYVGRKADSILKNVELEKDYKLMFAIEEDKRELVGPVAIPDIEIPRKDKKGNPYFVRFSKEVVRRMAEKFMREQKLSESNIQHDSSQDGKSYVYESWIIEHPEDKANSVYNLNLPVGSWVIKMRVTDPGVWAKVKAGEVKGFSLEGSFMDRKDWEEYQKDREIYNKVMRILKNS